MIALRGLGALSARHKLLALGLLALLLALPLLFALLLLRADRAFDALLVSKARSDLAVASGHFERVQAEVGASVLAVARSHALADAQARADAAALARLLARAKQEHALEFLELLPPDTGAVTRQDAVEGLARIELVESAQFERIAPELAGRVTVKLVPTPEAAPTERTVEDRAMVMLALAPVRALDGRVIGLLRGGVLLNRNLTLVDHIHGLTHPAGAQPFGSLGMATLFLDDVRIATNARLSSHEGSARAIGTRASHEVRDAVLGRGEVWLDRAFDIHAWTMSSYQPLHNPAGRRVGMLQVGYVDAPLRASKDILLIGIGGGLLVLMALAAALAVVWLRRITDIAEPREPTTGLAQSPHDIDVGAPGDDHPP